jgi:serine/threonine-protein kinase
MVREGTVLSGRYRLEALVGAGGFGSVYRARDHKTGETVAVKVLDERLARDPAYTKRFHREALIARSLRSPHVVKVFSSGSDDGVHYLVMEFIYGMSLRGILDRDGALDPGDAVAVASDIAEALAEAHAHGISHRDIKPDNIFVSSDVVKVGDFGIATAETLAPTTVYGLGTPLYESPEQVRGETTDARSDIYSLGVVLFEMLEGHPPFSGHQLAVMDAHLHQEPLLERTPSGVANVVRRCLAKSPDDRYQTAADLLADLHRGTLSAQTLADAQTVPAAGGRPPPLRQVTTRRMRNGQRRYAVLAGAGMLAVLCAVGAGAAWIAVDDDGADSSAEVPGVNVQTATSTAPLASTPVPVVPEGVACPSRLPEDAAGFDLPSAEPERSIVAALNCGNATLITAVEAGDTSVLSGALAGDALAYWEEESMRLHGNDYYVIPTRAEVTSIEVNGDSASVVTSEDWTLTTVGGSRRTCSYQETYEVTKSGDVWVIEQNPQEDQAGC